MTVVDNAAVARPRLEPKALLEDPPPTSAMVLLVVGVVVPFVALLAAVPVAWGWGLSWLDITIAVGFYLVSGFGVTVGFHRYFTHGAFKAKRWLRITLAVAGSLSLEGSLIQWVADHRRHHAFTDREGDPHSPWRFGASAAGLGKACSSPTVDGCSSASPPIGPASPPTSSPTATPGGSTASFPCSRWFRCSGRRCWADC